MARLPHTVEGWLRPSNSAEGFRVHYRTERHESTLYGHDMTTTSAVPSVTKDSVCGMQVNPVTARHAARDGRTFYCCGDRCRRAFLATPAGVKADGKANGCCG